MQNGQIVGFRVLSTLQRLFYKTDTCLKQTLFLGPQGVRAYTGLNVFLISIYFILRTNSTFHKKRKRDVLYCMRGKALTGLGVIHLVCTQRWGKWGILQEEAVLKFCLNKRRFIEDVNYFI